MKPRIVITGAAGFIGSNLADRLVRDGYTVVGVDDLSSGIREQVPEGVDFQQLDIRSPRLVAVFQPDDVIFHLGAKTSVNDCQNDPVDAASANVVGTVNVFEAACKAGVAKVIYAETSALYEGVDRYPTGEGELRPQSFYAVSKFATVEFAAAYRRFRGLRTTALRYFNVYGPRQDYRRTIPPVMSAFIISLLQGRRPTVYGTGEKRRDFIYVDDVNDFHLQCIDDPRTDGNVYNLGSGVNHSVQEILDIVKGLLKSDMGPIYVHDLPGEAQTNLADISSARALGWEPSVSLEAGLQRSIDYIRKYVVVKAR